MTEQKIEKRILDKFAALSALACVQMVGVWQKAAVGAIKGIGDDSVAALAVKVKPRSFNAFTDKEGSFAVSVELNVRIDTDAGGESYLNMSEALTGIVTGWHKSFSAYSADFAIDNEFSPTGFRLDGGDCGPDATGGVWTWLQNFTVQGIINN